MFVELLFTSSTEGFTNVKINQIKPVFTTQGYTQELKCFGFDGSANIFTPFNFSGDPKRWDCEKSSIAGSNKRLEFICGDSRSAKYFDFEVYKNLDDGTYIAGEVNGSSYKNVTAFKQKIFSVSLSKKETAVSFIGTDKGLYRSKDGFVTWSCIAFEGYEVKSVLCSTFGAVYAATNNGFYYSYDYGDSWKRIDFNTTDPDIINIIQKGDIIYELTTNGKLYYFTDIMKNIKVIEPGPVISEPKRDAIVGNSTTLKWIGITPLDSLNSAYHLQVSFNSSFGNLIIDKKGIKENFFQLNNLESGRTYYWRVKTTVPNYFYIWSSSVFTVK